MTNVLIKESTLKAIGDAIRAKTGKTELLLPSAMATEIGEITGSGGSSGSGGNSLMFYSSSCGEADVLFFSGSGKVTMACFLPTNAKNVRGYYKFRYVAKNSSGTVLGYTDYIEKLITSEADYTKTPKNGNPEYSLFTFGSYNVSYAGASGLVLDSCIEMLTYELSGAYIQDDILYLEEGVNAIFSTNTYDKNIKSPWYIRGIDMRKSNITVWSDFFGTENKYLEVIYLPPRLTDINKNIDNANLKELHFTSLTPPNISSMYNVDGLPTTCTIYVPTGTLDAYKSAANYPSPTTYTYVEE